MGNEHISFTTSKIGSLMDVQTSKDPEGLRIFYYLVQVWLIAIFSWFHLIIAWINFVYWAMFNKKACGLSFDYWFLSVYSYELPVIGVERFLLTINWWSVIHYYCGGHCLELRNFWSDGFSCKVKVRRGIGSSYPVFSFWIFLLELNKEKKLVSDVSFYMFDYT